MRRVAISLSLGCFVGLAATAHASSAEVVAASSTLPGRTIVAASMLDVVQGAHEMPSKRFEPLRAISIAPSRASTIGVRPASNVANELPQTRRMKSNVVVKDIRATDSTNLSRGFTVVTFGKELRDANTVHSVDVRSVAASPRMVMAQNTGPTVTSTEELHDVLNEVRSPQGGSGTVAVDIGTPAEKPSAQPRVIQPALDEDAGVTIVGRPGQRVIELTDADFKDIENSAPVLNRMNDEAVAQQQAAREALEARNEELREQREAQEQEQQDVAAESADAAPTPPAPREVDTVRRYDWRKGIYVRVPADEPPVPRPSIATGPANLVERQQPAQGGAVLQGRVPRLSPSEEPTPEPAPEN